GGRAERRQERRHHQTAVQERLAAVHEHAVDHTEPEVAVREATHAHIAPCYSRRASGGRTWGAASAGPASTRTGRDSGRTTVGIVPTTPRLAPPLGRLA